MMPLSAGPDPSDSSDPSAPSDRSLRSLPLALPPALAAQAQAALHAAALLAAAPDDPDEEGADAPAATPTALAALRIDPALLPRLALDGEHVQRLAHAYVAGAPLPPLLVWRTPDGDLTVLDGVHRAVAAALVGRRTVPCVALDGDRLTAARAAARANRRHGLPRSAADAWALAERWLSDPELQRLPNRRIAAQIGVAHQVVDQAQAALMLVRPDLLDERRRRPPSPTTRTGDGAPDDAPAAPPGGARPAPSLTPIPALADDGWQCYAPSGPARPGYVLARGGDATPPCAAPEEAAAVAVARAAWRRTATLPPDVWPLPRQEALALDLQDAPYAPPPLIRVTPVGRDERGGFWVGAADGWRRLPGDRVRAAPPPGTALAAALAAAHAAYAAALDAAQAALRALPSYPDALQRAGGLGVAPQPLAPFALRAIDPRRPTVAPADWLSVDLPGDALHAARHTMTMLDVAPTTPTPVSWWRGLRHQIDMYPIADLHAAAPALAALAAVRRARDDLRRAFAALPSLDPMADAARVVADDAAADADAAADDAAAALLTGNVQPAPWTRPHLPGDDPVAILAAAPSAVPLAPPDDRETGDLTPPVLAAALRASPPRAARVILLMLALWRDNPDDVRRMLDEAQTLPPAALWTRLADECLAALRDAAAAGILDDAGLTVADLMAALRRIAADPARR